MKNNFHKGYILGVSLIFLLISSSLLSYKHFQIISYQEISSSYQLQRKKMLEEELVMLQFIKKLESINDINVENIQIPGCVINFKDSKFKIVCPELFDVKVIVVVDVNDNRITDLFYE